MIVVVGLAFEARIAAGPGIRVICGGNGRYLPEKLERAIEAERSGLVSFGVAGGLHPELRPGTCIIASEIIDGDVRHPTDRSWSQRLLNELPAAVPGPVVGVSAPVAHPGAKKVLHAATGAIAVDMESQVVARAAARHRLPMVTIRVITDPAERALPPSALAGVREDGTTNVGAVLSSLLRRPQDFVALTRVALDTRAARAGLVSGRASLNGTGFALPPLGELELDIA